MTLAVLTEVQNAEAEDLLTAQLLKQDLNFELVHVLGRAPLQNSGRSRAPTIEEIQANVRSNSLGRKLDLLVATHVVLAGNVPLWTCRPDLRIGRMRRRPFVAGGRVMYPTINPVAALRNPLWAREIDSDLYHLGQIIEAEDWTLDAPEACVWCATVPTEPQWDTNGVLYCEAHWRTR